MYHFKHHYNTVRSQKCPKISLKILQYNNTNQDTDTWKSYCE